MSTDTKPLAEWTLEETYNYCYGYRLGIKPGVNCEETDCLLKKQGICMADYVHDWELTEKPRFTEDEVATMRVLYAAGVRYIARDKNGFVYWFEGKPEKDKLGIYGCPLGDLAALPESMFSSILPGDSVTIADIIKNEKEK